jgi:hypothetical protein
MHHNPHPRAFNLWPREKGDGYLGSLSLVEGTNCTVLYSILSPLGPGKSFRGAVTWPFPGTPHDQIRFCLSAVLLQRRDLVTSASPLTERYDRAAFQRWLGKLSKALICSQKPWQFLLVFNPVP